MAVKDDTETIGDRLARAMDAAGISAAKLARQLKITRGAVSNWRTGKGNPSFDHLQNAARFLGVSAEWLISGHGAMKGGAGPSAGAEGVMIDLASVAPDQARILKSAIDGRRAEVWRLQADTIQGAGYHPGDYLIVDIEQPARARDLVLAVHNQAPIFRMYLPPYLYPLLVGRPSNHITVDNFSTLVRGVIVGRHTIN